MSFYVVLPYSSFFIAWLLEHIHRHKTHFFLSFLVVSSRQTVKERMQSTGPIVASVIVEMALQDLTFFNPWTLAVMLEDCT